MDLDAVAEELYGLPPDEFIGVREERVRQARSAGQKELAAKIRRMRKPSLSAWAVNLLARGRPEEVERLLELGEQLRKAHSELRGEDLRQLSEQRSRMVSALGREGRRVADDAGRPIGESHQREVQGTLEAALADPQAAKVLRDGRLTSALSYSGLGPIEGVAAAGGTQGRQTPARKGAGKRVLAGARGAPADRGAESTGSERRREATAVAERALGDARRTASRLERALRRAEKGEYDARARERQAAARFADAEQELERAKDAAASRQRELERASRDTDGIRRDLDAARREVERAEARLEAMGSTAD